MYERVLVGTDGSPTATRSVEAAARLAEAHRAELVIAHAFSARPSRSQALAWHDAPEAHRWRLSVGSIAEATAVAASERARDAVDDEVSIRTRCEPGRPARVLLELIDELDPDVLVLGNKDMARWIRQPRSVSRTLSRAASCDVVLIDTVGRRALRLGRGPAAPSKLGGKLLIRHAT